VRVMGSRRIVPGRSITSRLPVSEVLGVTRQALNNLLNEKSALTPEMALRIEKAFGPKMDHLLRMQLAFDIARARRRERSIRVRRVPRTPDSD